MKFKVIVRTSLAIVLSAAVVGLFSFKGASAGTPGNIQRVSVNSSGGEQVGGNANSNVPSKISGNGRYVVFLSGATNLVANDTNGVDDVFVRDTLNNTTTRVNVSTSGAEANGYSLDPAISYDGRYVAFRSGATNLVANDTNGVDDVFVRDLQNNTTSLVSVTPAGVQGNDYSMYPAINADGRFIVFVSWSTNFTSGVTSSNRIQVYVKDMVKGSVRLVTRNTSGNPMALAGTTAVPSISCDGGVVAFASNATDLVANDINGQPDVFVASLVGNDDYIVNATIGGDNYSEMPVVSCNGNDIIYGSKATNLVSSDTNGFDDVFVYHRLTGQNERVSVNSSGTQGNAATDRSYSGISGNGRYVVFVSYATNIPRTGYTYYGTGPNVFVRDLKTGTTQLVSVAYNYGWSAQNCYHSAMSEDGSKVAFGSGWSYLVANDTGYTDIFTADTGF